MPKGPYKKYLHSSSDLGIPRTTSFNQRKKKMTGTKSTTPISTENGIALEEHSHLFVAQGSFDEDPCDEMVNHLLQDFDGTNDFLEEESFESDHSDEAGQEYGGDNHSDEFPDEEERIIDSTSSHNSDDESDMQDSVDSGEFHMVADTDSDNDYPDDIAMNVEDNRENSQTLDERAISGTFNLQDKLCPCSETTVGEALLIVMSIGLRHALPWTVLVDFCRGINSLYNDRVIPDTKYFLQKYFPSHIKTAKYHLYCPACRLYLGERLPGMKEIVCECRYKLVIEKTESYFIEFDLAEQLRNLLKNPSIVQCLKNRLDRTKTNEEAFEDMCDGEIYQQFVSAGLLDDWKNMSCTFNTDGCKHAKSSKLAVWPIFIKVNELPVELRGKHILMAGLWVDKTEPDMNLFLKPFVTQANNLMSRGFDWIAEGQIITSKLYFLCCSVDSPARCAMLNMKQFTGYFGCTYCCHPAKQVSKTRKFPVLKPDPPKRTDAGIKKEMVKLVRRGAGEKKTGILGPTVLMNLKNFDLVRGTPPDYMHACLLGVTRQYMDTILTVPGEDYYVGDPAKLRMINDRLTEITPPSIIHRKPRSLGEMKLWKASEWRSWLLFYSLPCLEGILPRKYVQHWSLFVSAMEILLKASITVDELERADKLIVQFVSIHQKFYGIYEMKYNVHLLLHLCDSVRNWGPLWTQNTFDFENQNRILLKFKHSAKRISTQIANKILSFQNINGFSESVEVSPRILTFCQSLHEKKLRWYCKQNDHVLIGNKKIYNLTDREKQCLGITAKNAHFFSHILVNRIRFSTKHYCEQYCTKINDSIVLLDTNEIGMIHKILQIQKLNDDIVTLILLYHMEIKGDFPSSNFEVEINHIKECELTERLVVCTPKNFVNPCVLMSTDRGKYVAKIPRGSLTDS